MLSEHDLMDFMPDRILWEQGICIVGVGINLHPGGKTEVVRKQNRSKTPVTNQQPARVILFNRGFTTGHYVPCEALFISCRLIFVHKVL
jgi:hypothetical protein